jgi:integrase
LDVWIHGERYQVTLGKNISRSVALELAQVERVKILQGEAGIGQKKRKDMTFEKAREAFLAAAAANNRAHTLRGYQQHLDKLGETIGQKNLSEISPFLLEKHKQKRIADDAPVGFNRELGTLRTLINWCVDTGKFEGANPTKKIKRIQESRGRERFLEPEEEKALLAVAKEPLRTMLMCGIYAGLRIPSEVLSLQWQDVDLRRGFLTVQGAFAKNGQTATLPLNPDLRRALEGLKRSSTGDYVFTKPDGKPYRTIQNIFRTACNRAGLGDVSPHVCRHTFASRLSDKGVSLRTIQELGRWADIRMVQRYANVNERMMKEAVAMLSEQVPPAIPPASEAEQIPTESRRLQAVVGE